MAEPSGGGGAAKPKTRSNTLRQTASAVFALTAVVPLLLFLWTVYYLGALSEVQVQVGLGFALTIALLGFAIFRGLMDQMSDLILALRRVLDLRERSPEAVARASAEALGAIEPVAGAGARAAVSPTRPPRPTASAPTRTRPRSRTRPCSTTRPCSRTHEPAGGGAARGAGLRGDPGGARSQSRHGCVVASRSIHVHGTARPRLRLEISAANRRDVDRAH